MTVSTTSISKSTNGNGTATSFPYDYKILEATDLKVIIRSATGAETVKATSTYAVTGVGADSGTIVFNNSNIPVSGEIVVVTRNVLQTQAIDYIANDPFPAETHEEGLDRATMVIQQVSGDADRSIKFSKTNTFSSSEFTVGATERANKVLSFDSTGELAVAQELGTFKGNSATTTTAAFNIRDIVKSTTTAQLNNIYICIKASPIGTALTNTTFWVLLVDAVSDATSATAAASSATAAASSATAATNNGAAQVTLAAAQVALATTQANNASSSATTSGNSATASGNSATASANSATAAAASADAFDDIYLGTKSSDPSTDNDGDALAAGMLYFNSTTDLLRVYTGSAWQNAAVDTTGFITLSGTQTLTNKTLTTPKIGTSILDTGGNELAKLTATSSAVNEFTIANAATNNAPRLSATGGDSNVDLDILAKGTGHVTIRGNTNSGAIQFNCESNTHGQIVIAQPHSATVTNTLTLPAGASSTLVSLVSADTLTNKTLTSPKINENVAVTSTATELNLLDGKAATNLALIGKQEGTNFPESLLVGTNTTGTLNDAQKNTGVGIKALEDLTSGDRNTAIGAGAGKNITFSSFNTAVGTNALGVVPGNSNTSIGQGSGANTTGTGNTYLGRNAGNNITSGDGNVVIGFGDVASATGDKQLKISDGVDGSVAWITGDSNGQVKLTSGYIAEVALTDASTITWNAATQPIAKVTLGASRTMGLPANPVSGQFISLLIIQDGTGSRTITWNAAYEFALDTAPTLTATANLGDLFTFRYNGAKWLEIGRNLALTLS